MVSSVDEKEPCAKYLEMNNIVQNSTSLQFPNVWMKMKH